MKLYVKHAFCQIGIKYIVFLPHKYIVAEYELYRASQVFRSTTIFTTYIKEMMDSF